MAEDPTPRTRSGATADAAPLPGDDAVARALRPDRPALARLRRRVLQARRRGLPHDRNLARLHAALAASIERRERRAARLPRPSYPDELPISARRDALLAALREHQVVVVQGETGSGKSTQLPKMLLELGYGVDAPIGHTQPRRLAARTLARRVADELDVELGDRVGFKIRFTDETGPDTAVKLMTDGVLLAETRRDRRLERYDAIIVDEAHERSLNIDFLLGYLRQLLPRRPDLKVVVTSATIDTGRFAEAFGAPGRPAPVVHVSGRTWPVEVRWRPPEPDPETGDVDEQEALVEAVAEALRDGEGDVLVFLPTQRDITETTRLLEGRALPRRPVEVLPLYARLSTAEQQRVFAPDGRRRVVLATNVAESSVTVPGIRAVVDTGLARIARFSARARIQRLPIERVSRASAEQRKGRCGRLGPGLCLRLFDEEDLAARDAFTPPEIQRSNLASVILQMTALKLGRPESFPFLDPPKVGMVRAGDRTLRELGALDARGRLTATGRALSRLPVDPRLGRMILAGADEGCLAEMLVVAAGLATRDPRERPPEAREAADAAHARLAHPESDVLGLLRLWDAYHERRGALSRGRLRAWCRERFLGEGRLREWTDVHRQLAELAREQGLVPGERRDASGPVHRAFLAGMLSHVARRGEKHEYVGVDGKTLAIWPGSVLFEKKPRWIVAAEIVETSRRYARIVARIDPRAIEPLARDLVERTHRDPRWDRKSGRVVASERVSFGGLTIVPRRRVAYDAIDPVVSRELFIRHALVEGGMDTGAPFLEHNVALVNEIVALEAKTRRRDLLADLDTRYDFYDRRLPPDVTGRQTLHRWRTRVERHDPDVLFMRREDLLARPADARAEAFPDAIGCDGTRWPLRYAFAPGAPEDGVTLQVPLESLPAVDPLRLEWLVPGMLEEKVVALVRSLPKTLRKQFVPVPDYAREVVARLRFGDGPLRGALADALNDVGVERVVPEHFETDRLPPHLVMAVEVLGVDGRVLARGRDLAAIRARLGERTNRAVRALAHEAWDREGITTWDVGELPERVEIERAGLRLVAYPTLVDEHDAVARRLVATRALAEHHLRRALRRLYTMSLPADMPRRVRRAPRWEAMVLHAAPVVDGESLARQLVERAVERAYLDGPDPIRDRVAFEHAGEVGWRRLAPALGEVVERIADVLEAGHAVRARLDELSARPYDAALAQAREQLAHLFAPRFVVDVPWERLAHYPRYLRAILRRFERLEIRGVKKDEELSARVQPRWERYLEAAARARRDELVVAPLERLRWLLEEARVSVFAQELGTAEKVSGKRLDRAWDEVVAAMPG